MRYSILWLEMKKKQWGLFLEKVNNLIKEDGYELYIKEYISGREVYDYRFYGVDVADKMDKNAIRDLIDEFKSGLIAKATNGDMSEKDYKRCRDASSRTKITYTCIY